MRSKRLKLSIAPLNLTEFLTLMININSDERLILFYPNEMAEKTFTFF